MKTYSYNLDTVINRKFSITSSSTIAVTQQDILQLQDLFLTNGFHHITVYSRTQGRSLIYTFLDALRCYNEIGCITSKSQTLRKDIIDIMRHWPLSENSFFIESFNFDFIWIEEENDAASYFQQKIHEFKYDCHLPIIILKCHN